MKRSLKTKLTTILLSLAMFLAIMPTSIKTVKADNPSVKAIQLNLDGQASNLIGAQESSIYFGNYYQEDNNTSKQPIKWRVLSNEKSSTTEKQELFLLSDMVLDCKPYNELMHSEWVGSSIRSWLNDGNDSFLKTAFFDEQYAILTSDVINDDNLEHGTYAGNNTEDKIFLLSIDEVLKLNIENEVDEEKYGFTDDASRQAKATEYAKTQGVNTHNNYAAYWLRSPGGSQSNAAIVGQEGDVISNGRSVDTSGFGVRPAFNLDASAILFTSDVAGAKAQSSLGLKEISETTTTEWKLTLLDTSRGFVATQTTATTKDTYEAGDTLSFTYKEAKTEDNEYISAIITDENNNVLYYGRLLQPTSATSTSETLLNVTLPDLADGDYVLHIFNEQYNGGDNDDNLTDYASKFSTTEFTIGQAPVTQYTIKFVNEDGETILQSSDWDEGSTPVYSGPTPTKSPNTQYTYTFIGWTPEITKVIGDMTYKATYKSTLRQYTVTFVNDDETVLQSSQVNYGEMPSYTGATPTKQADAQYTYTFDKWTPDITSVTGITTYTATYTATPIPVTTYTVTYKIENGTWSNGENSPIEVEVEEGEAPSNIPTGMIATEGYENGSWNTDPSTVTSITGDTEFTYTFVKKADPIVITYKNTSGNNSSWTKGDTKILDFTFKRSEDDTQKTYEEHFKHIEIDDNKVDNNKYTIGYGSIIIKLKPELLNTLSTGNHTLKVVFDDGNTTADFTIKEKGNNNNNNNSNNKPYIIPKTGVE